MCLWCWELKYIMRRAVNVLCACRSIWRGLCTGKNEVFTNVGWSNGEASRHQSFRRFFTLPHLHRWKGDQARICVVWVYAVWIYYCGFSKVLQCSSIDLVLVLDEGSDWNKGKAFHSCCLVSMSSIVLTVLCNMHQNRSRACSILCRLFHGEFFLSTSLFCFVSSRDLTSVTVL